MKNPIKTVDPHGCLLGTQKLRIDNALMRRKLANAYAAVFTLGVVCAALAGLVVALAIMK